MKRIYLIILVLFGGLLAVLFASGKKPENDPAEIEKITETLMNYIDGTANGNPDQVRKAFHPDFNLYTVTETDSLMIRSGEKYISNIKPGEKANRIGRILSIDYEKNAAMAKAEIVIPKWRVFTDYFLLLKYEGTWKIVQKSYTWRALPKEEKKD
ncbi:MAG: nuclear transport factor 2 family protein [Bacteroidia bacterium]